MLTNFLFVVVNPVEQTVEFRHEKNKTEPHQSRPDRVRKVVKKSSPNNFWQDEHKRHRDQAAHQNCCADMLKRRSLRYVRPSACKVKFLPGYRAAYQAQKVQSVNNPKNKRLKSALNQHAFLHIGRSDVILRALLGTYFIEVDEVFFLERPAVRVEFKKEERQRQAYNVSEQGSK